MALLAAMIALAVTTQAASDETIVVTGQQMSDLGDAADRCAQSPCTTRHDVIVSVRYAEALFRGGKYEQSKRVLAKSVSRNRRRAADDPIAVSQLYLAQANVAAHQGDQRTQASATFSSARVLHDTLPADAPDVLLADLRVADEFVRINDFRSANSGYVGVGRRALAAGQPIIADSSELRRAWLLQQRGRSGEALAMLTKLAAIPGDDRRGTRLAARVISARIARSQGDKTATDALLASLAREPQAGPPTLIWEPPIPRPVDSGATGDQYYIPVTSYRSSDTLPLQWVDIGFWIAADGTVDTPEVLRGSRNTGWAAPLVGAVAARRYTPSIVAPGSPGNYRIERFTLTADFETPVGSNIRRRLARPRYERLDLTEAPAGVPG